MIKFYKLILISLLICLVTISVSFANAADVTAQDLGVSEPTILPDSPFYFLKEWKRNISLALTFDNIKKAGLENKFAGEKLLELKKLIEKNASSKIIEKATDKYQRAMEKIKERADKIKESASDNEDVNKFLEKFTDQQVLQEKILQKLEEKVPADVLQKIKDAREAHLKKFQEIMEKLETNKKPACKAKAEPWPLCEKNKKLVVERDSSNCPVNVYCAPLETKEPDCNSCLNQGYSYLCSFTQGNTKICSRSPQGNANCVLCNNSNIQTGCQKDSDCPAVECTTKACGNTCVKRKCLEGKCVSDGLTPIADPCPTAVGSVTCKDSDGGLDYFTRGSVQVCPGGFPCETYVIMDACTNSNLLKEYYCEAGQEKSVDFSCPNGCINGACNKL